MSKKKRKPKVIHVDKVIIKADKVIIEDNGKKKHEDRREPERRDPWSFFGTGPLEASEEVKEEAEEEATDASEESNEERSGFSWF